MSVTMPTPSQKTREALANGVRTFMEANDPLRDLVRDAQAVLQVFSLGLKSIASRAGVAAAKPVGWRVMVGGDSDQAVIAHVHEALGDDAAPRMTALSRGQKVGDAIRVADLLNRLQQAQDQHYEARLLRVPGVQIEAFWLKPASGDGWVVPFLTLTGGLEVAGVYTMDDFLRTIEPLANKRLAYDESSQAEA
jgi:hypothetical protein